MPWELDKGYTYLRQGRQGGGGGYSCGMACAAMVVHAKKGGKPSEGAMAQTSRSHAGAYRTGTAAMPGAVQVMPSATVTGGGTMTSNLAEVLNEYNINATMLHSADRASIFSKATEKNPVILHVEVGPNRYGHFVVLAKYDVGAPKGAVILDPEYGVLATAAGSSFQNNNGDTCTLTGWHIAT